MKPTGDVTCVYLILQSMIKPEDEWQEVETNIFFKMVGLFLVPELDDLHAVAERRWCLSSVLEVSHSLHSHPAGKSSPLRKKS